MKKGKRLLEIAVSLSLIILGLALYVTLSRKQTGEAPSRTDYKNTLLNEGLTAYRLDQFDKAELLLFKAADSTDNKKEKAVCFLYIGNIYYKLGNYGEAFDFYQKSLDVDHGNVHALYNSALAALKNRETDTALEYAQRALAEDQAYTPNLILLGNIYYATGEYRRSAELLEKGSEDDPVVAYNAACAAMMDGQTVKARKLLFQIVNRNAGSEEVRGLACMKLGELTGNPDYFRSALEVFPSSPELRYTLALALYSERSYAEAADLLRSIVDLIDSRNARSLYGRSLFMGGFYRKALDFYAGQLKKNMPQDARTTRETSSSSAPKATRETSSSSAQQATREPGGPQAAQIMGDLSVKLSDLERARDYYRQALSTGGGGPVFINLFRILLDAGDYAGARKMCEKARAADTHDPIPPLCEAELLFLQNDPGPAHRSLDTAVRLSRDDEQDLMRGAAVYAQNGMYANAIQLYQRILANHPDFGRARAAMASVYFQTGHTGRARSAVDGIDLSSLDPELAYQTSILRAQVSDEDRRVVLLEELTDRYPERYEAYFNLGLLLLEKGDYARAEQVLQRCIEKTRPGEPAVVSRINAVLGVTQFLSGKTEEAVDSFRRCSEADPGNETAGFYLRMIGRLRQER